MRDPRFWWREAGIVSSMLWPIAALYSAITAARMARKGWQADIPVICVGNFTLGGTGKTPTAIALAGWLKTEGETPFMLTRGYGGRLSGPVQVDPSLHRAEDVGDEPLLLARHAPVIVSRDRAAGAKLAIASGASVIVMDDGLQNPSVVKDLSIAVCDGRRGFGNACVFPAGPLRAKLARQFPFVQAVLTIGDGAGAAAINEAARSHHVPVVSGHLVPDAQAVEGLTGQKIYAFAGIGDPDKFFATLTQAGLTVTERESFPDHHLYAEDEAARILARCEREGLMPVTTEKDWVRLNGASGACGRLAAIARILPVSLRLSDEEALRGLLTRTLAARRSAQMKISATAATAAASPPAATHTLPGDRRSSI